jgi:hypothetical protein
MKTNLLRLAAILGSFGVLYLADPIAFGYSLSAPFSLFLVLVGFIALQIYRNGFHECVWNLPKKITNFFVRYAAIWIILSCMFQLLGFPGFLDFYARRQSEFEGLVAQVKALNLEPGTEHPLVIDGYRLQVSVKPSGEHAISVLILDRALKHKYFYVYSEGNATPDGGVARQVAAHWWTAERA